MKLKIKIIDGTFFIINKHSFYIVDSSDNIDEIIYQDSEGNYRSRKNCKLLNVC
uniref:Uncharacterized protein n=1 Tax=viral metagenome TaxID=1070528 RepID=A0A6M3LH33_9ZZZZ